LKDPNQLYLELREKYWTACARPWEDHEFKKHRADISAIRQELSACITDLLKLGRAGNIEACAHLGEAHMSSCGVDRDRAKAIEWFRKAAEQGHVRAIVRLGNALMHPDFPETAVEGIGWLHRAADADDPAAMVFLGFAYRDGKGTVTDFKKADFWFTKAYEAGEIRSMVHIGRLHAWETQSPEKALPWLRRAADAGFEDSYWALVTLCSDPKSQFYSPGEAVHWLKAIANSLKFSAPRALVQLARMTRDGHGTNQDFGLAQTYVETALSLTVSKELKREA